MNNNALIEALRRELDGYIRRGMKDRAAGVQEVLAQLGCLPATPLVEIVPSELGGTPKTPATRVRKAPEPPKPEPVAKAPQKRKRS
jgi:hypothetical protein